MNAPAGDDHARSALKYAGSASGTPVPGSVLAVGLLGWSAAMVTAASLGWPGLVVVVALVALGCALLVRWAR